MILHTILFIVGLGLILAGANLLIDGSTALARRFKVPQFIVGLTIMAIGTSMPELVVTVLSAAAGQGDIAIGNIVGSNIFNVFVIIGICSLIRPMPLTGANIRRDIPLGVVASLVLLIVTSNLLPHADGAGIGRVEGAVMIVLYFAIMWYSIRLVKRHKTPLGGNVAPPAASGKAAEKAKKAAGKKEARMWIMVLMIVGGLAAMILGGELFVRNATFMARAMGVSESLIAITLMAGGTSLPELAASVVAIYKGEASLALGNVIGSNIVNILLILGLGAMIHPLSMGGINTWDILMVLAGAVLLFATAFTMRSRRIDRWEGAFFLATYAAYIWHLFR